MKITVVILLLSGFAVQAPQLLKAEEFERQLRAHPDAILIDVRTRQEYAQGHLAGAMLIDFYQNDFVKRLGELDKEKPVFVYCEVGGRSKVTAQTMTRMGFIRVYDLQNGIRAWREAHKPVVK